MLLLIVGLIIGVWLCTKAPRLEGTAESGVSVSAYVDGKRVDSYVKDEEGQAQ